MDALRWGGKGWGRGPLVEGEGARRDGASDEEDEDEGAEEEDGDEKGEGEREGEGDEVEEVVSGSSR
jgi:hypothetical protein